MYEVVHLIEWIINRLFPIMSGVFIGCLILKYLFNVGGLFSIGKKEESFKTIIVYFGNKFYNFYIRIYSNQII